MIAEPSRARDETERGVRIRGLYAGIAVVDFLCRSVFHFTSLLSFKFPQHLGHSGIWGIFINPHLIVMSGSHIDVEK
jgi:hypothetical protein